jgi:hypothetical protein
VVSPNGTVLAKGIERSSGGSGAFQMGQKLGDAFSVAFGAAEAVMGMQTTAGGAMTTVVTAETGVGVVVGVGITALGVAATTHGLSTASNGWNNMLNTNSGKIYKVPGNNTPSGKPYVGRTKQKGPESRGSSDGRNRTDADIIDTYDPANPGEGPYKEQKAMDDNGGLDNLDNVRREVNEERMKELEKKYGPQ